MIRKIADAVLGKNYVATALLYTGLALVIFAITPSPEGTTNAGEEDSFGLFCLICDTTKEIAFTTSGEVADVTINGTEMHGTWITTVIGYTCKRIVFSTSEQKCVRRPVRSNFQPSGSESWNYNIVVPNVYQCKLEDK